MMFKVIHVISSDAINRFEGAEIGTVWYKILKIGCKELKFKYFCSII